MYKPTDMITWQGRVDDEKNPDFFRFHQIVQPLNLDEIAPSFAEKAICLLGFASDEGVRRNKGRQGAAEGPTAIRKALANLPWHWDHTAILDAGNVVCEDGDLEKAESILAEKVEQICQTGAFPVVLGGGHEVAWGHFNGLNNFYKDEQVGIINFDAHFDIRSFEKGMSSGTMFAQIADVEQENFQYYCLGIQKTGNTKALFKEAKTIGVQYSTAEELLKEQRPSELIEFILNCDKIYITLCFDVIASAYAPGVSAPQPFGLPPEIIKELISHILASGKTAGFDIAEVAPGLDTDNRTSKLAAQFIFHLIDHLGA